MKPLENHVSVVQPVAAKPRVNLKDFMVLLNEEYDVALANLPKAAWEPLAALKAEVLSSLKRLADKPDEDGQALLIVRKRTYQKWDIVKSYLDQLVKVSPGVQALRSEQLVAGMRGDETVIRSASGIVAQQSGGEGNARKGGILRR